jgi:hypothetical protein
LIFCQTMRPGVKTEMPEGATNKDVMAKLGEMWASTGFQEEKIKAVQESMEDKRRVEQLLVETNIVVEDEDETETTVGETTVKVAPPVVKTPVKVAPPVVKTPSAPVKAKAKAKAKEEEEDTLMSMKTKLSILLSGGDDESEDEDEPLGGVVAM